MSPASPLRRLVPSLLAAALSCSIALAEEPAVPVETAPAEEVPAESFVFEADPVEDVLVEAADPIAAVLEEIARPAEAAEEAAPAEAPASIDPPTDETAEPLPAAPEGKAFPPMWRLADEDSEIWLLGTFHILPPGLDWRTTSLIRAADLADTVWFEAEVDTQAARQKTIEILRLHGANPPGVTLTSLLAPEDAARLNTIAGELGVPVAALESMRPWQAFLALSIQFIASQGFEPGSGVETVLLNEARARGRELKFFETVEEQLGFFTDLPPETEKRLLEIILRDWDQQAADFSLLFEAWRAGDAATIDAKMNAVMRAEAPEVYETLVANRNRAWADKIEAAMAGSGGTLIAVGAAHLVGDGSVQELLRAKGFTVERYGDGSETAPASN